MDNMRKKDKYQWCVIWIRWSVLVIVEDGIKFCLDLLLNFGVESKESMKMPLVSSELEDKLAKLVR